MFKLDPTTGLRDCGATYTTADRAGRMLLRHQTRRADSATPVKASCLCTNSYWYLFASCGGLRQCGLPDPTCSVRRKSPDCVDGAGLSTAIS